MRHKSAKSKKPRVIDLFSGAGLFGLGFALEGFERIASYDFDQASLATQHANGHLAARFADLNKTRPSGKCEVLIAGPPCQGFSSLGPRNPDDPRNKLVQVIPKWAAIVQPKIVVVENVRSFRNSDTHRHLITSMKRLGFEATTGIVNARNYSVAQNRVRSISVFFRKTCPEIPLTNGQKQVNVRTAFDGLPSYPHPATGHVARSPSPVSLKRIRLIPYGGDIRDLYRADPSLVPNSWHRVRDKIVDIWGRLHWEGTSNTIRTGFIHPSRGRFLHPEEDRPISFREAARLQSIPDNFIFVGHDEAVARQIGNAVPVNLARQLAKNILEAI